MDSIKIQTQGDLRKLQETKVEKVLDNEEQVIRQENKADENSKKKFKKMDKLINVLKRKNISKNDLNLKMKLADNLLYKYMDGTLFMPLHIVIQIADYLSVSVNDITTGYEHLNCEIVKSKKLRTEIFVRNDNEFEVTLDNLKFIPLDGISLIAREVYVDGVPSYGLVMDGNIDSCMQATVLTGIVWSEYYNKFLVAPIDKFAIENEMTSHPFLVNYKGEVAVVIKVTGRPVTISRGITFAQIKKTW